MSGSSDNLDGIRDQRGARSVDTTEIEIPETLDANTPPADPEQPRQLSARDRMMETIVRRAEEARNAEMAQALVYDRDARAAGLVYPPEEAPEQPETAPEAAPEPEPPQQAAPPVPPAPQPPAPAPQLQPQPPQLRTVELDGQRWEVTEEQYAQLARFGMLANVALASPPPPPPVVAAPPAPPAPLVDPERAREVIKQIQFGGEEAAVPALVGLIEDVVRRAPTPAPVDPNAIVARAVSEAESRAQLARDTATIRGEFPDIFTNPQLQLLAKINVDAIRARNAQLGRYQTDLDIYREAGHSVYDAIGRSRPGSEPSEQPAAQAAPMQVQERTEVVERKRAAPRPTQVVGRRAPAQEQPRFPTNSEIVERMRQSRGQLPLR